MRRPKSPRRPQRAPIARALKARPFLELLEDRTLLSNGQWVAVFEGLSPGTSPDEQAQYGRNLLHASGVADEDVRVVAALDLSGTFLLETPLDVTQWTVTAQLQGVPGFVFAQDYEQAAAEHAG
jgi:hypothetical protein